jgi:hypothetical protein
VSGPHAFAVRVSAVRQRHIHVHRISPRVRDDREPPLLWDETAADIQLIWVSEKQNIFASGAGQEFADLPVGQITLIGFNKSAFLRNCGLSGESIAAVDLTVSRP